MIDLLGKRQKETEKDRDRELQRYCAGKNTVQDGQIGNYERPDEASASRRRKKRRSAVHAYHRVTNKALFATHHHHHPHHQQHQLSQSENPSSESELVSDAADQTRSNTLKIRLNPMDFEYFTSVVRSEDELARKWEIPLHSASTKGSSNVDRAEASTSRGSQSSSSVTWQDMMDSRVQEVLDCGISQFEASLLIIQLLLALQDVECSVESSPAMHVLKFALDTLWTLEFSNDTSTFTGLECATLKASAGRLMLIGLEKALEMDEPTSAVIHNGLLPMTLRLLEGACSKPTSDNMSAEEGSLLQEFIFATVHAIIMFLHFLLHHRGTHEKFKDFLELFQLFTESQEGKLIEKTILTILEMPSTDSNKTLNRIKKVIDMIGMLMSTLKRIRQDLSHINYCRRTKHKTCLNQDAKEMYHHLDVLGLPYYSEPTHVARVSLSKSICSISSLFSTLTSLLKDSHSFSSELQIRFIKIMTMTSTCCCFPPKLLLASIISYLKKGHYQAYGLAVVLIEKTIFKELGGYPRNEEACNFCNASSTHPWDFLEIYCEILNPENTKLCHIAMRHLLKVTPHATFAVKQELLLRVFYPTFLKAKASYKVNKADLSILKFLIQSCLSAITNLIVDASRFQNFIELDGLNKVLDLLPNQVFVKSVYALLEICVIMEINCTNDDVDNNEAGKASTRPAANALFDFLDKETNSLLGALKKSSEDEEGAPTNEENAKQRLLFHQASGVWRAVAGVMLCSPKFRIELINHPIFESLILLAKTLAVSIATNHFNGNNFSFS